MRRPLPTAIVGLACLLALACAAPIGAPVPSSPPPSSSPAPLPSPSAELSAAEIRYALIDRFGPLTYCDPDEYPISRGDESEKARDRLPDIRSDEETFAAIAARLGLVADGALDEEATLAVYREWKRLNAVNVEPVGDGTYAFDLITETDPGLGRGIRSVGTIDARGQIEQQLREETFLTGCPICLARGSLIDTPLGPVAVESLRAGDLVWTLDATGRRVAMPVLAAGSTPVPAAHRVVHLVLSDGRQLWVSPGHPLGDGRTVGAVAAGNRVDGAMVVGATLVPYDGGRTFDLLPAGATGVYWANGVLLASTLR